MRSTFLPNEPPSEFSGYVPAVKAQAIIEMFGPKDVMVVQKNFGLATYVDSYLHK